MSEKKKSGEKRKVHLEINLIKIALLNLMIDFLSVRKRVNI